MSSLVTMLLADGRLPTGGHTQSAGVEAAVTVGDVHDLASTERYLRGRLATTGYVDAAFAAATTLSLSLDAPPDIAALDREYGARTASPHLRDVSRSMGRQLERAGRALVDAASALPTGLDSTAGCHRALVAGALVADLAGTPIDAARLEVHHLAATVVGAAVKLLGLDPTAAAGLQVAAAPAGDEIARRVLDVAGRAIADGRFDLLPADGGTLTEVLGQWHGDSTHRMFAA